MANDLYDKWMSFLEDNYDDVIISHKEFTSFRELCGFRVTPLGIRRGNFYKLSVMGSLIYILDQNKNWGEDKDPIPYKWDNIRFASMGDRDVHVTDNSKHYNVLLSNGGDGVFTNPSSFNSKLYKILKTRDTGSYGFLRFNRHVVYEGISYEHLLWLQSSRQGRKYTKIPDKSFMMKVLSDYDNIFI